MKILDKLCIGLTACAFFGISLHAADKLDPEVRYITPPNLNKENLGKRILCHRPMRDGSPQMMIEQVGDKVITHNYGHGGSGWTLGFGSVNYVNKLLTSSILAQELEKGTPITVIGAGALGLFTAYRLLDQGYNNITVIADKFDDLTSHYAAGFLIPVSMRNSPEVQRLIEDISIESYLFYRQIAEKKNRDFNEGAVIVPAYFKTREESGLEPYIGKVMEAAKDVILNFGNGKTHQMVSYEGIFIDVGKMMDNLTNYLKKTNKVSFQQRKITNFQEIDAKYIMNCAGLRAGELTNDNNLISVQGHFIMLNNQIRENANYMMLIYSDEEINKNGQKIKRMFCYVPKKLSGAADNSIGVIGGTLIEGATEDTPNEEEFDRIVERAKEFYGIT